MCGSSRTGEGRSLALSVFIGLPLGLPSAHLGHFFSDSADSLAGGEKVVLKISLESEDKRLNEKM